MSTLYIWRRPNNSVSMTHPGPGWQGLSSLAEAMRAGTGRGDGITPPFPWLALDDAALPYHLVSRPLGLPDHTHGGCYSATCPDRFYRDAVVWDELSPNKCGLDMAKARVIHMDKIRVVRAIELAHLDREALKVLGPADIPLLVVINAKKQALRDIPQTFSLAPFGTAEALKAAWPTILPRPTGQIDFNDWIRDGLRGNGEAA